MPRLLPLHLAPAKGREDLMIARKLEDAGGDHKRP